jgi:hypothetical protein
MSKAIWEVENGDDRFLACVDCAYKFLVELYEGSFIVDSPVKDKNYRDEVRNVFAAEDFFGEHAETICGVAHRCSGCNLEIGN